MLPGSYWAAVLAPLGLDAQFPVDYQLSFSLSHKCPGFEEVDVFFVMNFIFVAGGCTSAGHGTCLAGGVCACVAPWVLGDCSALSQPVLPDRVLSGRARVSQWDFYHIQIHSGNAVLVQMRVKKKPKKKSRPNLTSIAGTGKRTERIDLALCEI